MKKLRVRDRRGKNRFFVDNALLRGGWGKEIGPYGIAVYNAIAIHADYDDQDAWPSLQLLADLTGMSRPTVIKAVKKLESLRIIEVERNPHKPHTYYLLHKDEWVGVKEVYTRCKRGLPQGVKGVYPNKTHEQNSKNKTHDTPQPTAEVPEPLPKKPLTPAQAMFKALAEVCEWDPDLVTKAQRGQLNQNEKILRDKARATPDDLGEFRQWWDANDWRGKKGDPPQPHLVREQWQRFLTWRKDTAAARELQQRARESNGRTKAPVDPAVAPAKQLWKEACEFMRAGAMPRGTFIDYIQPLRVLPPDNDTFMLSADTAHIYEFATARQLRIITRALRSAGWEGQVSIVKGENTDESAAVS